MLKVMTLNLNYYETKHGPWPARKALIQQLLKKANPDIVALQAVRQDPYQYGGIDQATQLAGPEPGYPYVFFQPAAIRADGSADGSAILSRIPMAATEVLRLSLQEGLDDTAPRLVLKTRFDLPGAPFYLFNAHFSWVTEQAIANLKETLPFINAVQSPGLLVGDLNCPPDQPPLHQFCQEGWCDIWPLLRPHEPGLTFEADSPTIRIDYGWANSALKSQLLDVRLLTPPTGAEKARFSDHLGLLFDFAVNFPLSEPKALGSGKFSAE